MKIILAPNAFKNSLPAAQVAAALEEGLLESGWQGVIETCPVGDGGDGTGVLLRHSLQAVTHFCTVKDPLGRPVQAPLGIVPGNKTAIIEMADASGLRLLQPKEYNPRTATTAGLGQLIATALDWEAATILLCIGGSATVDGGSGALQELGIAFNDKNQHALKQLPSDLIHLDTIDSARLDPRIFRTKISVLCDVKNKLLGPKGAAAIFGPQKGASPDEILLLEQALTTLEQITATTTGMRMRDLEYGGAAGGVAAALIAFCGAEAVDGIGYFLNLTGFEQKLQDTDWVVTGEGAIDRQTTEGKAPFGVAKMAKEKRCRVIGVAGKIPDAPDPLLDQYFDVLFSINEKSTPLQEALEQTWPNLVKTGIRIGNYLQKYG